MNDRPKYRRGLVVGKFCPLHLGHELLIASAARDCDELVVVSYSKPEFDRCEPARRAAWLEARFPGMEHVVIDDALLAARCSEKGVEFREIPANDAPAGLHREFVGWLCREVLGKIVDAVFTSESYGDGFAAALEVAHVCVDLNRSAVNVSGTAIRADPHGHRALMAPEVYAAFVRRAAILGGESSGKSTLAARLAQVAGTVWAHEYGRELWERNDGILEFDDMLRIATVQVEREESSCRRAYRWLFCDTSPLTTLFYSLDTFGRAEPQLERLADRPYDAVLLCAPDIPFHQDGTRRDQGFRQRQHDWYVGELQRRGVGFTVIEGDADAREISAIAALRALEAPARLTPV